MSAPVDRSRKCVRIIGAIKYPQNNTMRAFPVSSCKAMELDNILKKKEEHFVSLVMAAWHHFVRFSIQECRLACIILPIKSTYTVTVLDCSGIFC